MKKKIINKYQQIIIVLNQSINYCIKMHFKSFFIFVFLCLIFRFSKMPHDSRSLVAVCQLNCTSDREKNFETCKNFIDIASSCQAKVIPFYNYKITIIQTEYTYLL